MPDAEPVSQGTVSVYVAGLRVCLLARPLMSRDTGRGLAAQRAVEGSEAVGPSEPLGCTEGQRVNLMTL
jgi:hypothetical protein